MAKVASKQTTEIWYAYYRDGHSLAETGKRFGKTRSCVAHAFQRYQLPLRSKTHGIVLSRSVRSETLAMYAEYQQGATLADLSAKYNMTLAAVQYRFATYKLPRRPNHRPRKVAA